MKSTSSSSWALPALLLTYAACWVVVHVTVMVSRGDGPELALLVPYLLSGWTFSGGEIPTFIWFLANGLFVGLLLVLGLAKVVARFLRRSGA